MVMTSTERSKRHRERLKKEGGRIVQVYLDPDVTAILSDLADKAGLTLTEIVAEAVQAYWEKLLEPGN